MTASTFNQHIGFLRLLWRCQAEPIPGADIRARVRSLAESMTAKTWRAIKVELLAVSA